MARRSGGPSTGCWASTRTPWTVTRRRSWPLTGRSRGPVAHWPSFLTSLATRRAIDRLRRRGRSHRLFVSLDDVPEPVAPGDSPVEHAQGAERLDEVRGLLAGLPDKQAEVFWLSCVEGMPHGDICEQLRISAGEVRVLLHRARARLRSALEHRLPDSWRNR